MPKTAASCCSSSSGNGASEPRATVCNDTVVSAPARAPTEIQPAIFSLWLISKNPVLFGETKIYTCDIALTQRLRQGSGRLQKTCGKFRGLAPRRRTDVCYPPHHRVSG